MSGMAGWNRVMMGLHKVSQTAIKSASDESIMITTKLIYHSLDMLSHISKPLTSSSSCRKSVENNAENSDGINKDSLEEVEQQKLEQQKWVQLINDALVPYLTNHTNLDIIVHGRQPVSLRFNAEMDFSHRRVEYLLPAEHLIKLTMNLPGSCISTIRICRKCWTWAAVCWMWKCGP